MRVLVFPCGSEIGLEAHRSLAYSRHVELVGGSSVEDHGEFVYADYVGGLPQVTDPGFAAAIEDVVTRRGIDLVLPAHDSVVLELARAHEAGRLSCPVLTSPLATCEIARSKGATYRHLADVVPTPRVFARAGDVREADFPVFLKPDVGQGSKGVALATGRAELEAHLDRDPTLLILQHLPGPEYTVDCFTDRHGVLRYAAGRTRTRVSNGISVRSEPVIDDRFQTLATAINDALEFRGVWFFQVKEDATGSLALLEVAPRVAGTMGVSRAMGVNLPLLAVFDRNDVDVSVQPNPHLVEVDRALESRYRHSLDFTDVYIDLDDCLLIDGTVNALAVAFLHECLNRGKRIHLVTRHARDLDETLSRHRLAGLFDSVHHLTHGEPKASVIAAGAALFIDDSFAERRAVHEAHGIPVFDPAMIDTLLHWQPIRRATAGDDVDA